MAQGSIPQGDEFLVNTYTPGWQTDPSITSLTDGGYVVTWTSNESGGKPEVFGQRYDASGVAVGDEFQVGSHTVGDQYMGFVAAMPDGGFMAVWAASGTDRQNTEVYGQRYDDVGATVGAQFQINSYATGGQWFPSITTLTDGGFVAIWHSEEQDGSDYGVYGQRYDASGATVGTEFLVNTYTSYRQMYPDVASLPDGEFVVTWTLGDYILNNYAISGQRYDANGAAAGAEFQVNTAGALAPAHSSVTSLTGGGFVVTWTGIDGHNYEIYGQRFDANGVEVGSGFRVNSHTLDKQIFSDVTGLADGGFVVTWTSNNQDENNVSTSVLNAGGIFGQRYDANGTAIGDEFQVNTYTADDQIYSSVTGLSNGGFVVAWQSTGQDDTGGTYPNMNVGIYAQQFQAELFGATLSGGGSDDTLIGGGGADTLVGGAGNDVLIGGTTSIDLRDMIYGGDGDDVIDGGYGNDELRGDAGNDRIAGGFGADTVIGGTGDDILTGSAFSDLLFGGDGMDFVNGGFGHDRVNGGADADRFFHIGIRDHGSDWIQDYNAAEGDTLLFGIGTATGADFRVTFAHTENAAGERSGDDEVEEAFVIYRPTGQVMWALVDGGGQASIDIVIGGVSYDLLG